MLKFEEYVEAVSQAIAAIEYPTSPAALYSPIAYTMDLGGKRLRPVLTLMACDAFGGDYRRAMNQAIGIELYHNFTLLHDDVMDKADVRRGKPTVHVRWNDNTAILSGDAMLTMAGQYVARTDARHIAAAIELFNTTAMEVYEGQQYDMEFESRESVPMDDYIMMIGLKTAVLIACAAKMGALIAGADTMSQELVYQYAYSLGLAFQVADDYLDTFGDPKIFGKNLGGDIANNKKTWLLVRALEKSGEMEKSGVIDASHGKAALLRAMEMNSDPQAKFAKVKEIYEAIGVDEDAKYEIIKLHAQAMDYAGMLGLGKVRYEILHRYADRLIGRTK